MQQILEGVNPSVLWIIVGIVFFIAELGLPSLVSIFFGLGSWTVAIITWFIPINFPLQIVVFAISSILFLIFIRKRWKEHFIGKRSEVEDNNESEYLGEVVKVVSKITPPSSGLVQYKGSQWQAFSNLEIEQNQMVEIIKLDGIHFTVKPIKEQN